MKASSPSKPKYLQFADQMRQQIESGELRTGDRLPSYAELRELHGLTQPTVDRGHALLERDGYIERIRGRGTFVALGKASSITGASGSSLLRKSIVLLAPEIDNPHWGHQQSGWTEYLVLGAIHQLRLSKQPLVTLDPSSLEAQDIRDMVEDQPAGVIVIGDPVIQEPVLQAIARMRLSGVPVVVYGDSPELANFDRVTSDHAQGSYDLTRWLIEKGCRRVLEVWPEPADHYWFKRRHEGYERAMQDAGREALEPCLYPTYSPIEHDDDSFRRATRLVAGYLAEHLSTNGIDAIMAATDGNVPVLAAACRLLNKEPNKDVVLVGYDHYWEDIVERKLEPTAPMVTVDKRNHEMGNELVRLLQQRVEGNLPPQPQVRVVRSELVVSQLDISQNAPS